jgi:adenine phosphoribosyltransferase
MSLNLLKKQLEEARVIHKGDYRYIINSICEQEPPLDPKILVDCADKLIEKMDWKGTTKILTPEAMGIHIATIISVKTDIPLIIATHRQKRIDSECQVQYECGYEKGKLHFNSIFKNDKILIIDDLISTGGTILALIEGLQKIGTSISDIGVIFNKVDYGGMNAIMKLNYKPKTLLNVKIEDTVKVEID